ncbi:Hypothetical protein CINCED_3A020355 [Cinara cedri]|uniref:Uncharacterized protein n=1 Tax=Cinara cedri TaxID=506608 RepID=A0A5E4N2H0_9HEMI|nr:Hypothetical protein CINCED_3A020355 [Cinara cedri]
MEHLQVYLQEAEKFVEQLDNDYSAVAVDLAAQQRPGADLLWYDYGGGGGGSNVGVGRGGGGGGGYYGGVRSPASGVAPAALIGPEKRGGSPQSGGLWFGPRLGRRKRRGGGGSSFNSGFVQPPDGNAFGPAATPQEAMAAAGLSTAAGQAVVSDLIYNAPWVLVPVVENSLYSQQMKQNARSGRSSSEDGDDWTPYPSSRHAARSPPYSPRLGRQTTVTGPQVPRLGREAFAYRRDARGVLYQQPNGKPQLRRQQQAAAAAAASVPIATEPMATAAEGAARGADRTA